MSDHTLTDRLRERVEEPGVTPVGPTSGPTPGPTLGPTPGPTDVTGGSQLDRLKQRRDQIESGFVAPAAPTVPAVPDIRTREQRERAQLEGGVPQPGVPDPGSIMGQLGVQPGTAPPKTTAQALGGLLRGAGAIFEPVGAIQEAVIQLVERARSEDPGPSLLLNPREAIGNLARIAANPQEEYARLVSDFEERPLAVQVLTDPGIIFGGAAAIKTAPRTIPAAIRLVKEAPSLIRSIPGAISDIRPTRFDLPSREPIRRGVVTSADVATAFPDIGRQGRVAPPQLALPAPRRPLALTGPTQIAGGPTGPTYDDVAQRLFGENFDELADRLKHHVTNVRKSLISFDAPVSVPSGPGLLPPFEPSVIVVDAANPGGQRLVFRTERDLRRGTLELGQRDVIVLPANATAADVRAAASQLPQGPPEVTVGKITLDLPRVDLTRPDIRAAASQLPQDLPEVTVGKIARGLDPIDLPYRASFEEIDALRQQIRSLESEIDGRVVEAAAAKYHKGLGFNSPFRQITRIKEQELNTLKQNFANLIDPEDTTLDVAGVLRQEPFSVGRKRIAPMPTTRMLGEPVTQPVRDPATGASISGQRPRDIPVEAMTPEQARLFRAEMRAQSETARVEQVADTAEQTLHNRAVARESIPPDNPEELLQRVSFPEGKPRLSDPPPFAQEVGVATITGRLPRLVRAVAQPVGPLRDVRDYASLIVRNPVVRAILRWTPGLRNPHLFTENSTQKAGLIRAALIDDGRQKIIGLLAHARKFGNQNDLFGRTDPATGLLTQGNFKGFSVNEIAENPSRFPRLSKVQRDWLDAMDGLEKEILDLYRRNNIPISEISLVEVERYAGRTYAVHVARKMTDGSIIERGFVGGLGRLQSRTGAEHTRAFTTMKQAQAEDFVPLSYEESFSVRAQSAYNRVVNKQTSDWLRANLPEGVTLRTTKPGEVRQFGERITTAFTDFPSLRVEGVASGQFLNDLGGMFPGAPSKILEGVNAFNAVQRIYSLAGDASIATIQFIVLVNRHPVRFASAMKEFGNSVIKSTINPRTNRARRNQFLVDNADIIQDYPGLILSDSGLEFTEALGRGGFLSPEGIYTGSNRFGRFISKIPGTTGGILRPFQQGFEGAMDDAGIKLIRGLKHLAGNDPLKKRELVDYVNNMRGLSSSARLGLTPNQRLAESSILLAPRYRRAVGALHASAIQGGLRGHLARQAYMALFAGTVSTYIGISYGLGKAQGRTNEQILDGIRLGIDPRKKQFLLWRAGTTAFGVGSKITSDLRLLGRIMTDPGDVTDFTDFNRNVGVRWIRSQLAAAPSDSWDLLVGSDYLGEPITRDFTGRPLETLTSLSKMLRDDVTFLWLQALAFEGGSGVERIIKGGSDFVGFRGYGISGPSYDDVSQAMYGKDFNDLALPKSKFFSSEQNKVVDEWNRLQTQEQRQQREEKSDKRAAERRKLQDGINLVPAWQYNLEKLRQQQ